MAVAVHRSNYLAFWVILIFTSWTMGSHLSLVWLDSQFPEVRPDTHCSSCPLTRVFPRNLTKDTLSTVVPLLYWDRVVSNTTQLATKIQSKTTEILRHSGHSGCTATLGRTGLPGWDSQAAASLFTTQAISWSYTLQRTLHRIFRTVR